MIYGYCRCSTNEEQQDVERQARELRARGCDTVRTEYAHGDSPKKPELDAILSEASRGDTLVVTEVSRLARSTKQLCEIIDRVRDGGLRLEILNSVTIDCSRGEIDPMTNAFLQMAGVFSELELQITRARVRSGMANAKAKGAKIGRPPMTADRIPAKFMRHYAGYRAGTMSVTDLANVCGISRTTAYSYIRMLEVGVEA